MTEYCRIQLKRLARQRNRKLRPLLRLVTLLTVCGVIPHAFARLPGIPVPAESLGQTERPSTQLWLPQSETEYVEQLLTRGMFDLARLYCERQISASRLAEQRAEWELLLAECYRQLAWTQPAASRISLIHLAAERLAEFLKDTTVPPALDLAIRLRQMDLIVESAEMQAVTERSSRWFVAPGTRLPDHGYWLRSREVSPARELLGVQQLSDALLDQMNQLRRELDADTNRVFRERLRVIQFRIQWLLAQFADDPSTAADSLDRALRNSRQLSQSISDDRMKTRLAIQTAEMELLKGDAAAYRLRLPAADAASHYQQIWLPLRIKGLLRLGQPSEALQHAVRWKISGHAMSQELIYLKLESLLAMYELVDALGDESLRNRTADEFQAALSESAAQLTGVWRESVTRVASRFHRVRLAGSSVADDLQEVDQLAAASQPAAARDGLSGIIARVSATFPVRSLAALHLRHGELSVQLSEWMPAAESLQQAADLFQSVHDTETAAAADLLRVYAVGRGWETSSSKVSSPEKSPTRADYEEALSRHLQCFAGRNTCSTAREWLILLLRDDEPDRAVRHLLTLHAETQQQPQEGEADVSPLLDAGELLVDRMNRMEHLSGNGSADKELTQLTEDFLQTAATMLKRSDDRVPASARGQLRLQLTELRLLTRPASYIDWVSVRSELAHARTELLEDNDSSRRRSVDGLLFRCDLPALVADVRAHLDADAVSLLTQRLQQATATSGEARRRSTDDAKEPAAQAAMDRLHAIRYLHRQYAGQSPSAGDVLLARVVLELMLPTVANASSTEEQIRLLPVALAAAAVTGDHAIPDDLLHTLLQSSLNESHQDTIANVLASGSFETAVSTGPDMTAFWQTILKRSDQGSQRWLEASLRLAAAQVAADEADYAWRILNVVDALYPDWGSAARRKQADSLRTRLQERR